MFPGGGTREPTTSPSSAIRRMMMSWASTASGDVALVSTLSRLLTSWALRPGSTNGGAAPFGGAGAAAYAYCDAGPLAELPDGVVTVTFTAPVPAGLVALMSLAVFTWTPVAAAPPNRTEVAPVKPVPWIATAVPPPSGPLAGLMLVITGSAISPGLLCLSAA